MIKIISPLFVDLPRKTMKDKRIYLNLNVYRNLNRFTNGDAKKIYCEDMEEQLKGLILKTPVALTFTLYRKDKRKGDRANPLSICEKFFCDALVHWGCLPDDTDEFIFSTEYFTGGIDRENPRVEIIIRSCENCVDLE
jgi:hypothetical protein